MICRLNSKASTAPLASFSLEGLEERRFLSAGPVVASHAHHPHPTPAARHVRHDLKHKVTATPAVKAHKHHGKALAKGHTKIKKNDDPTGTPGGTGTIPVISTQSILFATAPTLVQTGLQAQAPAGVRIDPNKAITVQTFKNGTLIYSTDVTVNGQTTHVSVDANGNPSTGPVATPVTTSPVGKDKDDDKESDDDRKDD